MTLLDTLAVTLAAYLWGSLSPAFFAARRRGVDLQRAGSGNVGSSNLGEQLGWGWTIGIGFLDLVKGLVPAFLTRLAEFDPGVTVLAGLATVVGHNWSIYLGFAGGRGMAAIIGFLFALDARLVALVLLPLAIGALGRSSAPTAMIGILLLAPGAWLLGDPPEVIAAGVCLIAIVALKRLEANRLPLPRDPRERRAVLLRRLWLDRDVPLDQAWEERKRIQ